MSARRGPRKPSAEELEVWERVAETVAPLRTAKPKPDIAPETEPLVVAKAPPPKQVKATAVPASRPPPKPVAPPMPSLTSLDRRTRTRLSRGSVEIERRIDLHGLTQSAAHGRLRHFLLDAQRDGLKTVLVITGKGRPEGDYGSEDRGVLRRMVPIWLGATDLRTVVIGFDEAGRSHGGAGALYVRVRRPRGD